MNVGELIDALSVLPDDMPIQVEGGTGTFHVGVLAKENRSRWPKTASEHRCESGRCLIRDEVEWVDVPQHVVIRAAYGPGPHPSLRRGDPAPAVIRRGNWPKQKSPSFEPKLTRKKAI